MKHHTKITQSGRQALSGYNLSKTLVKPPSLPVWKWAEMPYAAMGCHH